MHDFTRSLAAWYADYGRELPWRQTTDPYRVWVSEIILQQTRVVQGMDYYHKFIERFPTVEALASASSDAVMQQWEGLGYYSRARNMHSAAQQVVSQGDGFPKDYAGIRALKGVGDYTAAAIASFAYGLPHAVVDGNVYRVLSRYYGLATPIDTARGKKEFAALADEMLDQRHPARHNQAIMDFGALQCVPGRPDCTACPLSDSCVALAEGRVEQLPVKSKKTALKERFFTYLVLLEGAADTPEETLVAIHRRPEGDIWAGLYEPLLIESSQRRELQEMIPSGYQVERTVEHLRHQLTHRTLYADAVLLRRESCGEPYGLPDDFIQVSLSCLKDYAAPRLVNIIYERLFS